MHRSRTSQNPRLSWTLLLGILSLLLVLIAGTLSVAHIHTDGLLHADCSACVLLHAPATPTPAPTFTPLVIRATRTQSPPHHHPSTTPPDFPLFSRPPPALPAPQRS